ncbi:patatin-like phospholipase family protein [Romboutsia lituseburensis]|uniref:patatin-like phospholipase family protein n=1 Tax=Romboutsia lituseburensis TaxID=1537 RepID=UPI00215A36FF|nr:patatin-like phospholipase family protein [Romboutsia lituseburensis]MCR8745411.1 patatin-like phospholipase family protein [Romboutsia lituseburensis]
MENSTFNIVSFDGGGLRGALSICIFENIQKKMPDIIRKTNMLGGTSTGSLIALGLAYGLSCSEVRQLYSKENVDYIFDKSYSEMLRPKYNNTNLKELLLSVFPEKLKLKDLGKLVVIPSFYIGSETSEWKPVFYNNIPNSATENERVIDVAMSSSAAPVFFPTYQNHIDGGIIATDPGVSCVIHSISKEIGKYKEDLRLLSFGTGYNFNSIKQDTTSWGALDWIISKNPDFPIISMTLEGNAQMSQIFSKMLLEDNYERINPRIDRDIGMDDCESLQYLIDLGTNYDISKHLKWIQEKWVK